MKRVSLSLTVPLAIALLLMSPGCEQATEERHPTLPPGFAESQVPQVPLNVYIYLDQGKPVPLDPQALGLPGGQAQPLALHRLALWAGSEVGSFGLQARFASEEEAQILEERAATLGEALWWRREGVEILLAYGQGEWNAALREALQSGAAVPFQEAHPEGWKSVLLLPESPPQPPVAAGALMVDEALLVALSQAQTPEVRRLGTALRTTSAAGAAFAVYTSKPLALTGEINAAYVRETGLRIVVAIRTRLVGPLLSTALSALGGGLNLETVQIGDREVFRYQAEGITALLVPQGSTLYVVAAPSPASEEELLAYLGLD